jgi:Flp pilus assembly pilin Flp
VSVHLTDRFLSPRLIEHSVRVHTADFVSELVRGRFGSSRGDRGATATEYALMVSLIAVVLIASVTLFGRNVSALFLVPTSALNP